MALPAVLGLSAACAIYFRARKRTSPAGPLVVGLFMAAAGQDAVAVLAAVLAVAATQALNRPPASGATRAAVGYVSVEGLPGAGKTTVVERVGGQTENVERWKPFLDWQAAAEEPGASLAKQVRILADYFGKPAGRVTERSWLTCLAFSAAGPMASGEPRYKEAFLELVESAIASGTLVLPRRMVFMECSIKECASRIKRRGQPGDAIITLEYLTTLNAVHDVLKRVAVELNIECVTLSGDAPEDALQTACAVDDGCPPLPPLTCAQIMRVIRSQLFFVRPKLE